MSPIRVPELARYPADWREISDSIRHGRAGGQCECVGECGHRHSAGRCPARHLARHPVTNAVVVLTVAHLDHTPVHCDLANLRAFCQRCHLSYEAERHAAIAGMTPLFDIEGR